MKRFFKRVINRFRNWVNGLKIEEKISFSAGAIIGILCAIIFFIPVDKVPASATDYEIMEKQVTEIEQNSELLYKTNCNVNINNEFITVSFENEECRLIAQYNSDFEVLSIQKEDKYIPTLWVLLC